MKKVLIVEDDDISRLTLEINLKSFCQTYAALSEEEIEKTLTSTEIDVVLMDINLGENSRDGTSIMQYLKSKFPEKEVTFVALTAYSLAGDRERFLDEGFDFYLSKPVNFDSLTDFINRIA